MAQGAPADSRCASRAREPGTSVASSRCLMGTWPSAAQTSEDGDVNLVSCDIGTSFPDLGEKRQGGRVDLHSQFAR